MHKDEVTWWADPLHAWRRMSPNCNCVLVDLGLYVMMPHLDLYSTWIKLSWTSICPIDGTCIVSICPGYVLRNFQFFEDKAKPLNLFGGVSRSQILGLREVRVLLRCTELVSYIMASQTFMIYPVRLYGTRSVPAPQLSTAWEVSWLLFPKALATYWLVVVFKNRKTRLGSLMWALRGPVTFEPNILAATHRARLVLPAKLSKLLVMLRYLVCSSGGSGSNRKAFLYVNELSTSIPTAFDANIPTL